MRATPHRMATGARACSLDAASLSRVSLMLMLMQTTSLPWAAHWLQVSAARHAALSACRPGNHLIMQ